MIIVKRPAAKQDLINCGSYIASENPAAADRFLNAAEKTFQQLSRMPEMGPLLQQPNARLATMRFWPISGFRNYLVFYYPRSDGIEIVRVLHGARDWTRVIEDDWDL